MPHDTFSVGRIFFRKAILAATWIGSKHAMPYIPGFRPFRPVNQSRAIYPGNEIKDYGS
jgi:hypothetical protein